MAYKTFVVERTEDESTQTAGPAVLHRNNAPQLLKVYDTVADVEADIANIDTNEIVGTKEVDLSSYTIVNRVAEGNLNPVTSNAVAGALSYSTDETPTGGKWIDGKTIYRKCYSHDGTSSVSGVLDTFTNVNIIKIEGMAHISTGVWLPFGFSGANDVNARWNKGSNNQLLIEVGSYTLWGYNAIVEYTKTTD